MEQVQVRILCQVMTAQYGTLNTGAMLRTDAKFAKHLIEDCGAAEYVNPAGKGIAAVEAGELRQVKPRKTSSPKVVEKSGASEGVVLAVQVQTSAQEPLPEQAIGVGSDDSLIAAPVPGLAGDGSSLELQTPNS